MLHLATPEPDLQGIVDAGIVVRQAALPLSCFPAMPQAMLTLAPVPGAGAGPGPVVFHPPSTRPTRFVHDGPFQSMGLVLPAVTAARLMGPSTGAVVDIALPWATIAGDAEAARLHDELHRAASHAAGLSALQASLRRVLQRGGERTRRSRTEALQHLVHEVGREGPRATRTVGLGERQLERRCRALLGMPPKQWQRLTRLQAVLADALHRRGPPDADAALAAGFYDQSHLAREVRALAGAPLRELLAGARADGCWWPLAAGQRARTARHPLSAGAARCATTGNPAAQTKAQRRR